MSESVLNSYGVNESEGVNNSFGVNWSGGVNWSYGVNSSYAIHRSIGINFSSGIHGSEGVNGSYGVINSYGVNDSFGVTWSSGVDRSFGVTWSYGVNESCGVDQQIFCSGLKRTPKIFGKEVSQERFDLVFRTIKELQGNWRPQFNNIKSLYIQHGNDWKLTPIRDAKELSKEEAWSGMPRELFDYIKSLPEFDAQIFEDVTGINCKTQTIKIEHDGNSFEIDIEKAEELGLLKEEK